MALPDSDEALGGRLVVATPALGDPNFERTVVLLLEHGSPGAVGVVLNRPMHVGVGEILAPWEDMAGLCPPGVIFSGGPVSPDAVIGLCRPAPGSADDPRWKRIVDDAGVVDLAVAPEDQPVPLACARLFSGYAGWGGGQLEQEIDDGSWFVLDATAEDPFCPSPEDLWHDVLQRQGGRLAMLASYPPSPSVN